MPGNNLKERVQFFAEWDYNIKIAGVSFRQKELGKLYERDWNQVSVRIEPEPDNKYDANAVAVYADDIHVGYIPGLVAPHITSLINKGQTFKCALIYITNGNRGVRTGKIALQGE